MTSERKLMHLEICRDMDVGSRWKTTHLEDVELVHLATPELDLTEVDLSTAFLGKKLSAPLIISAMTGGHPSTRKINESLAKAAAGLGLGICVGSQRAALEDPSQEETFRVVRDASEEMPVIANIGAAQLLSPDRLSLASRAVSMLKADAIAVHLNPLQEIVQPMGDTKYRGVLSAIRDLSRDLGVPLVAKETGCGISREVARSLVDSGVSAIEVAGAGGTSWAAVEYYNALKQGERSNAEVAETFWDWGIPTAMSICEVRPLKPAITLIASGGIKNGLDIAKSIALGADLAGVARELLIPAFKGYWEVSARLERMVHELKAATLLSGARDISSLRSAPVVLSGGLLNWIRQRGLDGDNDD
ncbi:MAG: type 2 isopentenyl-diphosphate Delta-isomerase [Candidatus Methanosuratus sp.]|nr:type 2 isopentenyl-diphosphate Delta-isomerase [Candidatus Methanosuratincola sp.]